MNDFFLLVGKNIFIIGVVQGIGYLLVIGFGCYGVCIIVNDIILECVEIVVMKFQQEGIKVIVVFFNVIYKQDIEVVVEYIEKDIGVIDVLINNVGIQCCYLFIEFFEQEWNDVIVVNQIVVFFVFQVVMCCMVVCQVGKVINICLM